jgi:hypothetical protein
MTADELHTALKGGQTLAQVAESKGVNVQVVVDALIASATNHINEKVASGELTQAEADEKLANVTERVTERVNNPRPEGGPRGGQGAKRGPAAPETNCVPRNTRSSLTPPPEETRAQRRPGRVAGPS